MPRLSWDRSRSRQGVAQISVELGIHMLTLYNHRKTWRVQGEVVTASRPKTQTFAQSAATISSSPCFDLFSGPAGALHLLQPDAVV